MNEINVEEIVKLYEAGNSMRGIAKMYDTNHKLIGRVLKGEQVETRKPLNLRGKKKFQCGTERLYHNMKTHIRFDVELDWFLQFENIEKVKMLNAAIQNRGDKHRNGSSGTRFDETSEWYMNYIKKFYHDNQFDMIFNTWIENDCISYLKPSIDHIIPRSKGGENNLDNLQFLTWFENKCKHAMTQEEWNNIKNNLKDYFV